MTWMERTIAFLISAVLLGGCSSNVPREQGRAAIGKAMERFKQHEDQFLKHHKDELLPEIGAYRDALRETDVSDCPKDFRDQYWKLVEAFDKERAQIEGSLTEFLKQASELKAVCREYNAQAECTVIVPN